MHRTLATGLLAALAGVLTGCGNNAPGVIEASGTIEGTDITIGSEVGESPGSACRRRLPCHGRRYSRADRR